MYIKSYVTQDLHMFCVRLNSVIWSVFSDRWISKCSCKSHPFTGESCYPLSSTLVEALWHKSVTLLQDLLWIFYSCTLGSSSRMSRHVTGCVMFYVKHHKWLLLLVLRCMHHLLIKTTHIRNPFICRRHSWSRTWHSVPAPRLVRDYRRIYV